MKKIVAIAALSLSTLANSYTPPIGIPDPKWSGSIHPIDAARPKRPSNWGSSIKGFYFVNPASKQATDSGNPYGSTSKPRKTIPRVVPAGSYVEVQGTFNQDEHDINYKCTAKQPCWLVGNASSKPNIKGYLDIQKSSYLIVDGFTFIGGEGSAASIRGASHHIAFRHSTVADRKQYRNNKGKWNNHAGVGINAGSKEQVHNIVVYKNTFSKLGQYTYSGKEDPDFHGMAPSVWNSDGELRDVWLLNNNCASVSGDCVQINAGGKNQSWKRLHHIYVGKNVSSKNRQTGIWIKQASDVIVSQNKIYGARGAGTGNGGGGIGYQYEKNNLWILFNEIYDSNYGIRQSKTGTGTRGSEVHIIGNVIYDIKPATLSGYNPRDPWSHGTAIALHRGNMDRFIVDNTIHNAYDGINIVDDGGVDISGNIISDIGSSTGNRFFTTGTAGQKNHVSLDYNLFYDDARQEYLNGTSRKNAVTNVADLSKKTPAFCKTYCNFQRPGFVKTSKNSTAQDFRLTSSSPALGKNRRHYSYDRFEQLYGLDIYKDFNGKARNKNTAIGAFESSSAVSNPKSEPSSPKAPVVTPKAPANSGSSNDSSNNGAKPTIQIRWPTKRTSYTTKQSRISFGGTTAQNKTLKEISWRCTQGCKGSGKAIINRKAGTGSNNWHISRLPLSAKTTVIQVTAVTKTGASSTDSITFKR